MGKQKKELSTQAKTRLAIFGPICLVCIFAFLYSVVSYGYDIYNLQIEKDKLDDKYANLQEEAEELKVEITKLQDPEYIARFAREQYLYSKDGELIIKVYESESEEAASVAQKAEFDRMSMYASLGVLILIFLYITIKSAKKRNQ